MLTLLVILVIGAYAVYVMTPDERLKLARRAEGVGRQGLQAALDRHRTPEPFRDALRARTPWALVTGAIIFINLTAALFMSFSAGPLGDPDTLLRWGANFGPLTTNGEWWRLASAVLLHAGFFHLLIHIVGLAQVGVVMERMIGHLAFATAYVAAGLLASLETLSSHPMAISAGSTGAVFGVYGLLIAALIWNVVQRASAEPVRPTPAGLGQGSSSLLGDLRGSTDFRDESSGNRQDHPEADAQNLPKFSLKSLALLAPSTALFFLYAAGSGSIDSAALTGLVAGFACGLVFTRRANKEKPPLVQTAAAMAVALVVTIGSAAMLSGVADVRPEIAKVVALEDRTTVAYEKAVNQFKNGAMSSKALARMIDQSIVPELRAAQARLKSVKGVPEEHQGLVAGAEEYLRLRDESWRLRAEALHKSNMNALRAADRSERASLEALQRLRPVEPPPSAESK